MTRDARLRERCLGVLEGAADRRDRPGGQRAARATRVVDPDARPEGGESLRDFYRRVAGFADELAAQLLAVPGRAMEAERAGEIAVVAHGGTLRVLNAYLRGIPVERMRWEPLSNGCIMRSPTAGRPSGRDRSTNPDERE